MEKGRVLYYTKTIVSAAGISLILNLPVVSLYPLLLWAVCLVLFQQKKSIEKREWLFTWSGALLFGIMLSMGLLQEQLGYGWKVALVRLAFIFAGSTIFFQWFLTVCFTFLDGGAVQTAKREKPSSGKMFGLCYLVMILFWLPAWLAHAPAFMSSDTIDQIQQALGIREISNHHPAIHTLLLRGLYKLTRLFGVRDINISFAVIGLLQLLAMAAVCAGAVAYVYRWKRSKGALFLMMAFYGLVAYNAYYSITLWKDILHAGITVLLLMVVHAALTEPDGKNRRKLLVAVGVVGVLFCLFRSNATYALFGWCIFLLLLVKKSWTEKKAVFLTVIGALALSMLIKGPVYSSMGFAKPVFTESLSIPLQQVACVVANNRELSEEETEMINRIAGIDGIRESYVDYISDPIKSLIAMCGQRDYLEAYKGEYLKLWFSLGIKYPKDYLFAWINQTKGYWYPNTSYWVYFGTIMQNDLGLSGLGIVPSEVTAGVDKWVERYKEIPLYGSLWNLGVYSWTMILLGIYALYKKRWEQALLVALPLCLWGTLLISTPVYAEFRYLYAVILSTPLLTGLIYGERSGTPEGEEG